MELIAMCMPILPGKKGMWLEMMSKVKEEPMATAFTQSRADET